MSKKKHNKKARDEKLSIKQKVLKSITANHSRWHPIYYSMSVVKKSPVRIVHLILLFFCFTAFVYFGYRLRIFPVLMQHCLNITVYGYEKNTGTVIDKIREKHSKGKTSCDFLVDVSFSVNPLVKAQKTLILKNITCNAKKGELIKIIHEKENPEVAMAVDEHGLYYNHYMYFFVSLILLISNLILDFKLIIEIIDYRRKFSKIKQSVKPLILQIIKEKDLIQDIPDLKSRPLQLLSSKDIISSKRRRFEPALTEADDRLRRITFEMNYHLSPSRYDTVTVSVKSILRRVCHIYGIKESDLRKAVGLPSYSSDRMIYFTGPWISAYKVPDDEINLYITEDWNIDYYTEPRK
ncbi:MAG: hypothetical protein IJ839_04630 [Ruminobacter sp.]|nr:hypothetical protein [Ruminobacter sp.]